jgi:hypothetical protein
METPALKNFSDFGIEAESTSFIGKSIEIVDILDQEIIIHDYKIKPSKHPKQEGDLCLHLQIEYEGKMRVVFSGSFYLQQMIQKVSRKDGFPFLTTIKREKNSKRLEFK